jgi:acyl-CoA thioester hydrolase
MVKTEIRVIYGDTDQMGVVYYANYLRYFEVGRNEYLRARGIRYRELEAQHHLFLPVIDAQITYKKPARYDDLLDLETRVTRVGRASVRFEYRVLRGETLLATGHTMHACVSSAGGVEALPEDVAGLLRQAGGSATPA